MGKHSWEYQEEGASLEVVMTEWIDQTFCVTSPFPTGAPEETKVLLSEMDLTISVGVIGDKPDYVVVSPRTRKEANQLSMVFRKASKRLEEIGKGMV